MSSKGMVLLGGLAHESNSFTPVPMRLEDFRIYEGADGFHNVAMGDSEYAGALRRLVQSDYTVFPTIAANATVGGLIEHRLFDYYVARLSDILRKVPQGDVVGVQWILHGSASVIGHADAQSELLAVLRTFFPEVPLVVSMDLHSTVTPELLRLVDGLLHYRTAPHADMAETGSRASALLDRLISAGITTARAMVKLPLLLPGEFGQTGSPIMQQLYEFIADFAHHSSALDVSLSQGFPWADNPEGTVSLVGVWPEGEFDGTVLRGLQELARTIWRARHDIYRTIALQTIDALPPDMASLERFTMYCDSGDNPTAGGTEDRVDVLAYALDHRLRGLLFLPIVDASFVARCHAATPGQTVSADIGGILSGTRSTSFKGRIVRSGQGDRAGRWAVVEAEGNWVVATERRFGVSTPNILWEFGFEFEDLPRALVVKSGYLFPAWKGWLAERGGQEILLSTPGATTLDLGSMPYCRIRADNFPLTDRDSGSMTQYVARGRASLDSSTLPLGEPK